MKRYTIKDLTEGKCSVSNDGTIEELNRVLKLAFPMSINPSSGDYLSYVCSDVKAYKWTPNTSKDISTQSVKTFIEELDNVWKPKEGEIVLVGNSDNSSSYSRRIYISTTHEKAVHPFTCVTNEDSEKYRKGKKFNTVYWRYMKRIEEPIPREVTMEEICEKFGEEIKIIK